MHLVGFYYKNISQCTVLCQTWRSCTHLSSCTHARVNCFFVRRDVIAYCLKCICLVPASVLLRGAFAIWQKESAHSTLLRTLCNVVCIILFEHAMAYAFVIADVLEGCGLLSRYLTVSPTVELWRHCGSEQWTINTTYDSHFISFAFTETG